MLEFFGRGAAFADEHNSAFFSTERDLVLIDCPATTFQKVKKFDLQKYEHIFVLITHTHGDHAGGLGMFLQYVYFVHKKLITVVAPSIDVQDDLLIMLKRIEGCAEDWFNITTSDRINESWLIKSIQTQHTDALKNKCFGYILKVDGRTVVFTGDSHILEPFKPFITQGSILYTEIAYYKSEVHMYYEDILPILRIYVGSGVAVYLMHLDNEEEIVKHIGNTGVELVPLFAG